MAYSPAMRLVNERVKRARLIVKRNEIDTKISELEAKIMELSADKEVNEEAMQIEEKKLREKLEQIEQMKEG